MTAQTQRYQPSLDDVSALAKRRGFVFQSSEIYGGAGGVWDYGPLGTELKRNVKQAWWHEIVETRDDVVPFDAAILMNPQTWVASGHAATFHDKMVDCKVCKHRFRADHLPSLEKCPDCGSKGSLTEPRNFNLMLKTFLGPAEDTASQVWLRPETAQGIFVNFKNVAQAARRKPPFGIAQIGKAFRNEITPGNFTFRTREFEQAELEFFIPPDGTDEQWYRRWVEMRMAWYRRYLVEDRVRFRELEQEELAHYAKGLTDVEYHFPWGWGELESIANRGTYDLTAHIKESGKDLSFFDETNKAKYVPIVVEASAGVDRTALALLIDAYDKQRYVDQTGKEAERVVLRFHRQIAPVKAAVFALARNKPELVERARAIEHDLRRVMRTQYDEGNIGQLYRRQDEVGTPWCITVDYQTLDDGSVTLRDRDSMEQTRLAAGQVKAMLLERLSD